MVLRTALSFFAVYTYHKQNLIRIGKIAHSQCPIIKTVQFSTLLPNSSHRIFQTASESDSLGRAQKIVVTNVRAKHTNAILHWLPWGHPSTLSGNVTQHFQEANCGSLLKYYLKCNNSIFVFCVCKKKVFENVAATLVADNSGNGR